MLLSTFVVTSTGDSGPGSLRSAITSVNADPSPSLDFIEFNLPPTAPKTINLKSALPVLTHQVWIDGFTQPGRGRDPVVELNGSAVPGATGLTIRATGAVTPFVASVQGLKIDHFATGIKVDDAGSSTAATIDVASNDIVSAPGGNGIIYHAGTGATTGLIATNHITTVGAGSAIGVVTAGTTDKLVFEGNKIKTSGGGDGIVIRGTAADTVLEFNRNDLVVRAGGKAFGWRTRPPPPIAPSPTFSSTR
jgi:hypothetical protein